MWHFINLFFVANSKKHPFLSCWDQINGFSKRFSWNSKIKNQMIKTASLTRPGREKGSPLTTRVWGWSQWAHQNHTVLRRENTKWIKSFSGKSAERHRIRNLYDLLTENKGWRVSKSQEFYHSPIMWHLATWPTPFCYWLHACYIPNHSREKHSPKPATEGLAQLH